LAYGYDTTRVGGRFYRFCLSGTCNCCGWSRVPTFSHIFSVVRATLIHGSWNILYYNIRYDRQWANWANRGETTATATTTTTATALRFFLWRSWFFGISAIQKDCANRNRSVYKQIIIIHLFQK
jgi:hypothetical protein